MCKVCELHLPFGVYLSHRFVPQSQVAVQLNTYLHKKKLQKIIFKKSASLFLLNNPRNMSTVFQYEVINVLLQEYISVVTLIPIAIGEGFTL